MKTGTIALVCLGFCLFAFGTLILLDVVTSTSNLIPAVVGTVACLGAAALRGTRRLRSKSAALLVLAATLFVFLNGAAQLWLFATGRVSWKQVAIGLVFMGIAVTVFRCLGVRVVTEPSEPPGPGPLAPA
jgi:hypothetical protein